MATTTRKTPQDRRPAKAELDAAKQLAFEEVEGHELLIPFSKVKGSDQARLMGRLMRMGLVSGDEGGEAETTNLADLDLEVVADFIDYVAERFAVDLAAFEEFTCGPGGMERALELSMAYAGELGKDAA